ncbi:hypothetical protein BT63DRAFT_377806 [Microthyrium microscopicum]|uniref:Uncharacterized protein n=1 Tax=Microthyrium microscopicum TaxID=703497 RepID=A0A6A6U0E2_9PEZI|nr:hypothetical protein BT63DRAFT_377806 [Microthyrium microscopicum]
MDDAVSLHTTTTVDFDDAPELRTIESDTLAVPPPYTDHDENQQQSTGHHVSDVPYNSYNLSDLDAAKTLDDGTKVLLGVYQNDPKGMEAALNKWAQVPPIKIVQIRGTHQETTKNGDKKEQKRVTDFDVKLRLTEYLFTHPGRNAWAELRTIENHTKAYRGTVLKTVDRAANMERTKPSVKEWCHMYDASHAVLKKFRFKRYATGLDEKFLTERLENLVRATNYKGHLVISFPVENPGVDIFNDHWINRWRNTRWIFLLFCISMLWIITWPVLFFLTKKYEVVRADWPFSYHDEFGNGQRQFATISEKQWFAKWQKLIAKAIVSKRETVLTEEDLVIVDESLPQYGDPTIDSAINFLGAGIRTYQEVNRQVGWGYDT